MLGKERSPLKRNQRSVNFQQGMIVQDCNSTTWEGKTGGPRVQGHLDYILTLYLKTPKPGKNYPSNIYIERNSKAKGHAKMSHNNASHPIEPLLSLKGYYPKSGGHLQGTLKSKVKFYIPISVAEGLHEALSSIPRTKEDGEEEKGKREGRRKKRESAVKSLYCSSGEPM